MSDYRKQLIVDEDFVRLDWPGHGLYRGTRPAWEFWYAQTDQAQIGRYIEVHGLDEYADLCDFRRLHCVERAAVLAEWDETHV